MDGSRFVTLNIRASSMHGLQVSGRELRHRGSPEGDLSADGIDLHAAVSEAARLLTLALASCNPIVLPISA